MPEVERKYAPIVQQVQTERLNKQIGEAKNFANKVGIDFDEKLPDLIPYLSRPENRGRLTAKEALMSLYGDEILDAASKSGSEKARAETKELMEKKKQANMQATGVAPSNVVNSDEMKRRSMNPQERLHYDLQNAYKKTYVDKVPHPGVKA
jgi:hypothetical protein